MVINYVKERSIIDKELSNNFIFITFKQKFKTVLYSSNRYFAMYFCT